MVDEPGCKCKTNVSLAYDECDPVEMRDLIRNNICDDVTNNAGCLYDGGDCCRPMAKKVEPFCIYCQCLDPDVINTDGESTTQRSFEVPFGLVHHDGPTWSPYRHPNNNFEIIQYPDDFEFSDYEDSMEDLHFGYMLKTKDQAEVRRVINHF